MKGDFFHHHFLDNVERHGNRPALHGLSLVSGDEQKLTYSELYAGVARIAQALEAKEMKSDAVVGIYADRTLEALMSVLAVLCLGGTFVLWDPVQDAQKAHRFSTCFKKSAPQYFLSTKPNYAALGQALDRVGINVEHLGDFQYVDLQSCASSSLPLLEDLPKKTEAPPIRHCAYLMFTSGSTGQPKGVQVPYGGLWSRYEGHKHVLGDRLSHESRVALFADFAHDAGLMEWMLALGSGGCGYLIPEATRSDHAQLFRYYHEHRISIGIMVPSVLREMDKCRKEMEGPSIRLESLQALLTVGEAAEVGCLDSWRKNHNEKMQIINGYGPTEATIGVSLSPCFAAGGSPRIFEANGQQHLSINQGEQGLHESIHLWLFPRDKETGMPAFFRAAGERDAHLEPRLDVTVQRIQPTKHDPGELYIAEAYETPTPGLALGYLGEEEKTCECFFTVQEVVKGSYCYVAAAGEELVDVAPGCYFRLYRTNDQMQWGPGGQLIALGRYDRQVKLYGDLIDLSATEWHLNQGIQDSSVLQQAVVFFNPGQKRVTAVLQTQHQAQTDSSPASPHETWQQLSKDSHLQQAVRNLHDHMQGSGLKRNEIPQAWYLTNENIQPSTHWKALPLPEGVERQASKWARPIFHFSSLAETKDAWAVYTLQANELSQKILSTMCEVLDWETPTWEKGELPPGLPTTRLVELGVDSMRWIQLRQRLSQDCHLAISSDALPQITLGGLLVYAARQEAYDGAFNVPSDPSQAIPVLFCFPGIDGDRRLLAGLPNALSEARRKAAKHLETGHQLLPQPISVAKLPCVLWQSPLFNTEPEVEPTWWSLGLPETLADTTQLIVNSLLKRQPKGPYYLCGWSYGGTLVCDIAQQLVAHGRTVAYLGVFDSETIEAWQARDLASHTKKLKKVVKKVTPPELKHCANAEAMPPADQYAGKREASRALLQHVAKQVLNHIKDRDETPVTDKPTLTSPWWLPILQHLSALLRRETRDAKEKRQLKQAITLVKALVTMDAHLQALAGAQQCSRLPASILQVIVATGGLAQSEDWRKAGVPPSQIKTIDADHFNLLRNSGFRQAVGCQLVHAQAVSEISGLRERLRKDYQQRGHIDLFHDKQQSLKTHYVPVKLMPPKPVEPPHGKTDKLHKSAKPMALVDIFSGDPPPRRVFIAGQGGMGKSTLCRHAVTQWAEGQLWPQFALVLWIDLAGLSLYYRNLSGLESLTELLNRALLPKDGTLDLSPWNTVCTYLSEQTLLILDGYDELPQDAAIVRYFNELLSGGFSVLVTSRHHAKPQKPFDLELTMEGFGAAGRKTYIKKAMPDEAQATAFIEWMEQHTYAKDLAATPFLLEMLCYLYQHTPSESLGQLRSLSQFYERLIKVLYDRRTRKLKESSKESSPASAIDPPTVERYLSRLAYQQFPKTVLEYRALQAASVASGQPVQLPELEEAKELALLKLTDAEQGRMGEPERTYAFSHTSFQEYYAAQHWVELLRSKSPQDQKKAFAKIKAQGQDPNYFSVLTFMAGMLSESAHWSATPAEHAQGVPLLHQFLQTWWEEALFQGHIEVSQIEMRMIVDVLLSVEVKQLPKGILSWLAVIQTRSCPYIQHLDFTEISLIAYVASMGRIALLQNLLQELHPLLNKANEDVWMILHSAADSGQVEVLKYLLTELPDVSTKETLLKQTNAGGWTVLHVAVVSDRVEVLKYLLTGDECRGIFTKDSLLEPDESGQTILHYAADLGHLDVLKYLLTQHADIFTKESLLQPDKYCDETVLHYAARSGQLKVLQYLLTEHPDIFTEKSLLQPDEDGQTILHRAARSPKVLQYLLTKFPKLRNAQPQHAEPTHTPPPTATSSTSVTAITRSSLTLFGEESLSTGNSNTDWDAMEQEESASASAVASDPDHTHTSHP